jgi:sugar phosphate isomerase/epimerase
MLRRTFLNAIAGAGVSAVALAEAPVRFRLGLDSYSLRAFGWKAIELIDYAASQQLDAIQLDMENLESRDREYLQRVRDHAAQRNIYIDAATGCVCPTSSAFHPKSKDAVQYLNESIETARAIGAFVMRCFLGSRAERNGPLPIEAHMEAIIRVFRAARQRALDAGVKIALENHNGDLAAREVRTIIEQSGKDFVGSCLDTGNPMWLLEDPVETVEILGPYAVTSHIRDSVLYEHPRGVAFQWVALGDGTMNWAGILERFARLCPHVPLQMEVITGRPPQVLPYLEPEFWKAFPHKPAEELARFIALAKKGHPFDGFMVVADSMQKPPAEYAAALREQQRRDFERSVAYARERLGLGIRGRP